LPGKLGETSEKVSLLGRAVSCLTLSPELAKFKVGKVQSFSQRLHAMAACRGYASGGQSTKFQPKAARHGGMPWIRLRRTKFKAKTYKNRPEWKEGHQTFDFLLFSFYFLSLLVVERGRYSSCIFVT